MASRDYTTRRQSLVEGIVAVLNTIDGTDYYLSDLQGRVFSGLKFWDEIKEFPAVFVTAGGEVRNYQGGGYKDRYIAVTIRIYVQEEDPIQALDLILEDIETVLEENSNFAYTDKRGFDQKAIQTTIVSIDTDEGLLSPIGAGEVVIEVLY